MLHKIDDFSTDWERGGDSCKESSTHFSKDNLLSIVWLVNKVGDPSKNLLQDLVYVDICGLINVEFLRGNWYFVSFIDNASKKSMYPFLEEERLGVFDTPKKRLDNEFKHL